MAAPPPFPAFPFTPYPIQLQFMTSLYHALDAGGVAIMESPTGTGKTLSLICSALQWLQDRRSSVEYKLLKQECPKSPAGGLEADGEPAWMRTFSEEKAGCLEKRETVDYKKTRRKIKKSGDFFFAERIKDDGDSDAERGQRNNLSSNACDPLDDEGVYLLDDYGSGDEHCGNGAEKRKSAPHLWSSSSDDESSEAEEEERMKVFFCSRTHSQLSQFVRELQRTTFSSSLKTVSLGSRKALCINPAVSKLGNSSRINERCLELQNSKRSGSASSKVNVDGQRRGSRKAAGCPMMRKQSLQRQFKEEVLQSGALDIEDMVDIGNKLGTCPYYGSRRLVPKVDLVILPYQSLLHRSTRETLGVNLKGSVVIIDEAHNLVDSVNNMHSCYVYASQLRQASLQLSDYLDKFRNKLSAGNRRYIQTLLVLIQAFLKRLSVSSSRDALACTSDLNLGLSTIDTESAGHAAKAEMMTINDFLFSLNIDNINMLKLWNYMKESNIVHKVSRYSERMHALQVKYSPTSKIKNSVLEEYGSQSSFHALANLVLALMNMDDDGRVLVVPSSINDLGMQGEAHLKFVMLNAEGIFSEVVDQAHAVVLAGGTLQPIEELRDRLFPQLQKDRLHVFSCGHIVPKESVLALAVARGPSGRIFDFTYQLRGSAAMMDELGRLLCNLSSVVPEGIVVFFPSFDYESQVYTAWKSSGILAKLEARKYVFQEPRGASSVDLTLQQYKESIMRTSSFGDGTPKQSKTGAIMLCVVGGKMSEGINFSDGMGRCVVMVGLPYPSPEDPELIERMKYLNKLPVSRQPTLNHSSGSDDIHGVQFLRQCGHRARDYYENLCMKAVNQSIGRAIRHIGDFAAILLIDVRYTSSPTKSYPASKLPGWIKDQLVNVTGSFGEVHKLLHQFFKHNKRISIQRTCVDGDG